MVASTSLLQALGALRRRCGAERFCSGHHSEHAQLAMLGSGKNALSNALFAYEHELRQLVLHRKSYHCAERGTPVAVHE
jgi:hypothetical protein